MSRPTYLWRKLTPKQREELMAWRKQQGLPWHRPPHRASEKTRYHVTAACFEHRPYIGHSEERMRALCGTLLGVIKNPAGAGYKLSFTAQSNRSYTVQYKNAMSGATWTTLQQVPAAYGLRALEFVDPATDQPQRFYRAITPQQ